MTAALLRAMPKVVLPLLALAAIAPALPGGPQAFGQPRPAAAGGPAVVLPFTNISGHSADDWIGTGIAESLASDLNRAGIAARRTEAAAAPRAAEVDLGAPDAIVETGRSFGAAWLVAGAYQRAGDRLRITARVFLSLIHI